MTMSDLPTAAVASFFSALRTVPIWLLAALALAAYAVLFAPGFAGIDPAGFRTEWGVWAWIHALTFSILTVARAIDAGIAGYRTHRKTREGRRALRFIPLDRQRWWHLAKQQDDSFASQISLDIEAANITDRPVRIVKARLIRPKAKGELLHADVSLPMAGSPYYSHKHPVPPQGTVTASLHIMIRGALARQGQPLRVTVGIIDQFGEEYRLKRIVIPTNDKPVSHSPWPARIAAYFRELSASRSGAAGDETPPPTNWQHQGKFDSADMILNEEKRNYAARGRSSGGLGSLNVTLQSKPNLGWTTVGDVPQLLWDKANAKPVESPNAMRLLRLHNGLDDSGKAGLQEYLLSHLHKKSPYADVSYFIFLALHRMGRTVDALRAARTHLAGDKVNGYSNLLGTLSAIVSHEHFDIPADLLAQILAALAGDTEHNFQLTEKINLARLQQLDQKTE